MEIEICLWAVDGGNMFTLCASLFDGVSKAYLLEGFEHTSTYALGFYLFVFESVSAPISSAAGRNTYIWQQSHLIVGRLVSISQFIVWGGNRTS